MRSTRKHFPQHKRNYFDTSFVILYIFETQCERGGDEGVEEVDESGNAANTSVQSLNGRITEQKPPDERSAS